MEPTPRSKGLFQAHRQELLPNPSSLHEGEARRNSHTSPLAPLV